MLPLLGLAQTNSKVEMPMVENTISEKQPLEIKRNATYNLEEIKVRWKKAALENCTGVPCIVAPPFTCGTTTISDLDGNSYNTILIGTQCWTKENLKVTKYNDGTTIPDETANTAGWGGLATGARTEYVAVGLSGYVATYGYLYNWYAATEARKICPNGWHVPTDEEWTSLIQFIVPTETISATVIGSQSPTAGGKLKSTSTAMWPAPGFPGSDNYGFSAFPGGYRNLDGGFTAIRGIAFFLSAATEYNGSNANRRFMLSKDGRVRRNTPLSRSVVPFAASRIDHLSV
jgi:uncharacterized protein (TIGR02145 family)